MDSQSIYCKLEPIATYLFSQFKGICNKQGVFGQQAKKEANVLGSSLFKAGQDSTDFLEWLSFTVREALRASEQHESMKRVIRELRASLEDKFGLAAIQVCTHSLTQRFQPHGKVPLKAAFLS